MRGHSRSATRRPFARRDGDGPQPRRTRPPDRQGIRRPPRTQRQKGRPVILVDARSLIALIDRGQPDHDRCVKALLSLTAPMVTTWPAFTEAMYMLGSAGGWKAQEALWKLLDRGDL